MQDWKMQARGVKGCPLAPPRADPKTGVKGELALGQPNEFLSFFFQFFDYSCVVVRLRCNRL